MASFAGSLNRHMQAEAGAFLDALDHHRRKVALMAFDTAERFDWHYIPRDRPGLHLCDMNEGQRQAALSLLRVGLSDTGFAAAQGIMALEEVLKVDEAEDYDPLNFAFSIFGNPETGSPWSWRVDGHHLSLTFTITDDETVVALPHFMGANPAGFGTAFHRVHSVLGEEEEAGRAVMRGLSEREQRFALLAEDPPADIVTGPGREHSLHHPAGLALGCMGEHSRAALLTLVEVYAARLCPELADFEFERLRQAGPENLHFAWAGGLQPGQPHYYRIHGPSLVIEYDNTQNHANHIHTVWHDPKLDFGRDLLREHYGEGH